MRYLSRLLVFSLLMIGVSSVGLVTVSGQNLSDDQAYIYYIAPDENGILQVWRHDLTEAVTITDATAHITQFDISDDNSAITFVSDATLWYDVLDNDNPANALTALFVRENDEYAIAIPTFNPDGTMIYYGNPNVYRIGIEGGTPELLIENVLATSETLALRRLYDRVYFLSEDTILMRTYLYEGIRVSSYNLTTGDYQEAAGAFTFLTTSADQIVLAPYNGFNDSVQLLHAPIDSLASIDIWIDEGFRGMAPTTPSGVADAIEIEDGVLRVAVYWFGDQMNLSIFDYVVETNELTEFDQFPTRLLSGDGENMLFSPEFFDNGNGLVGLADIDMTSEFTPVGTTIGRLIYYDIASGEIQTLAENAMNFSVD